jgi:hypothetical protein
MTVAVCMIEEKKLSQQTNIIKLVFPLAVSFSSFSSKVADLQNDELLVSFHKSGDTW